jgi:hypothetical protein
LQRPTGVDGTAVFPKNTVIIGLFFEGKILFFPVKGYPAAPGFDEFPPVHGLKGGQGFQVPAGEEYIAALVTAAGGTPLTGKTEPASIKRLFCHRIN